MDKCLNLYYNQDKDYFVCATDDEVDMLDKRFIKLGKASSFIFISASLTILLSKFKDSLTSEIILCLNAIINISIYFAYNEIIKYKQKFIHIFLCFVTTRAKYTWVHKFIYKLIKWIFDIWLHLISLLLLLLYLHMIKQNFPIVQQSKQANIDIV
jgi:hypothetical protein